LWATAKDVVAGHVEGSLGGCLFKKRIPGMAAANVPVTASLSDNGKAMGAGWFSSITVTGTFIDNEIQGDNSS